MKLIIGLATKEEMKSRLRKIAHAGGLGTEGGALVNEVGVNGDRYHDTVNRFLYEGKGSQYHVIQTAFTSTVVPQEPGTGAPKGGHEIITRFYLGPLINPDGRGYFQYLFFDWGGRFTECDTETRLHIGKAMILKTHPLRQVEYHCQPPWPPLGVGEFMRQRVFMGTGHLIELEGEETLSLAELMGRLKQSIIDAEALTTRTYKLCKEYTDLSEKDAVEIALNAFQKTPFARFLSRWSEHGGLLNPLLQVTPLSESD